MTFAKLCLGATAALLLAGCDAAAGVQFNMQMAEMEREHEAMRAMEDALWPASLPKAPAGEYRLSTMKNGKVTSKEERCYPARTVRMLMNSEVGSSWCPLEQQSMKATDDGWRYHAACDFSELGQGKQDITITIKGGLSTSFTVEKVKVYAQPTDGKTRETLTTRWDYRGAC